MVLSMVHRSPRALALQIAAVVVAITTAALVASDLASLHRRARDFGPERGAVVARRDLPLGATVRATDLREQRVHTSQLPRGVLNDRRSAIGRTVVVAVLRDGYLVHRNLAPRRRTGLDGALPRGKRALRVVVTDSLRPRTGAAVDVIAAYESDPLRAVGDSAPTGAVVVAPGVLVLATDAARTADGASGLGVTLLVTPRQARDLVFAASHGVVTLALVPPEAAA